eukprot:Phypoly_transcript_07740.p1 GENE.Phypoly_transcript_07740~~Phypoly_transcript_07740.p1  ORF type:complete len:465 (+),score=73.41 Phypoly_transcript_07740:120-1514(+)
MEHSEEWKRVIAITKDIEEEVEKCKESIKKQAEYEKQAQKDIEDHFARCMRALNNRKAYLLEDLALKVRSKKKSLEHLQTQLNQSLEGCKKILKEGSAFYSNDKEKAATVWSGANDLPVPQVAPEKISAVLPGTFLQTIQYHGKVLVADYTRFVKAEKVVTLAGGSWGGYSEGNKTQAKFNMPYGASLSLEGDSLLVCDCVNNAIRKITFEGEVSTHVPAAKGLAHPCGLVMDKDGTLYVVNNGKHSVSKVSPSGEVSLLAGSGTAGFENGMGTNASFARPWYIAMNQQTGNLFVSDSFNNMIRKITPEGEVSTLVGTKEQGFADGSAKEAKFFCPQGICFDELDQSLLVCDSGNNRLRKVLLNGYAFTVCKVPSPVYVTVTANRTIFIASATNKIYKVSRLGPGNYEATVVAGTGEAKRIDGKPLDSGFHSPHGIAVHEPSNTLFVAESGSHSIRKITFHYPS